jgi:hypothetical protein
MKRIASTLLALFHLACYSRVPPEARELWDKHEGTLTKLCVGGDVSAEEFVGSVRFFLAVTKIQVPGDGSSEVDWYPNKETCEALPELREWYLRNEKCLGWNRTLQAVSVVAGCVQ